MAITVFHTCSPDEDSSRRPITPPMLWPTSTMCREAGAVPEGSKRASVCSTSVAILARLIGMGALVG